MHQLLPDWWKDDDDGDYDDDADEYVDCHDFEDEYEEFTDWLLQFDTAWPNFIHRYCKLYKSGWFI